MGIPLGLFISPLNANFLTLVSITLGILASYWIDYGTQYIGGTRCAPNISYTGGTPGSRTFDPISDVGPNGCTGQSDASWRFPFALQIVPGLALGIGMLFFPDTPRWLLMQDRDEDAMAALGKLRRLPAGSPLLDVEYLEIKAEVLFDAHVSKDKHPNLSGFKLQLAQVSANTFRVWSIILTLKTVLVFGQQLVKLQTSSNWLLNWIFSTVYGM